MQSTIIVEGMTCGHCANAVTEELLKLSTVLNVQVDVDSGVVTVDSQSDLSAADVSAAIEEAGYTVREMN